MNEQDFINAGFTVVGSENNENKLLSFLKEHYPNVIRDTEINLEELKAVLGLPIDEKVNGYGLNFVGRNFARAKYAQKTEKELRLNNTLSKNIDTTENLVLKGDNLDSLKILKNHYSGKIKCIYIDPPYNTTSDEFVYPDKFDKEEAEVLGLANLSESDFARMDFSFKTKKSHNGWLAFMYPRLLLARDLLRKDGVIFISIDDNEQANLKLLCDDVFGEENFVANIIWEKKFAPSNDAKWFSDNHDHILIYSKNKEFFRPNLLERNEEALKRYKNPDNDTRGVWVSGDMTVKTYNANYDFEITTPSGRKVSPPKGICWRFSKEKIAELILDERVWFGEDGENVPRLKRFLNEVKEGITPLTIWYHKDVAHNQEAAQELRKLFEGELYFETPKPVRLIKRIIHLASKDNEIILDFFAGSGTTGQAVMQLNADDGGKRKFILCQVDEAIKEDKPAYKFCLDSKLPPVISSLTIERLKRAGDKIIKDVETENSKNELFEEDKKQVPDIGFKVFDSVEAPKLKVDDKGQISITENDTDAISRIYNMVFTVGLDEPTQVPEEVVKDCIYKIGNHYYITNSEQITSDDYSNAIKNGKVFIDGWTASLNGTLQNYKEDVKVVF
ncbi:MAG: site-specific DNA-methyltransferase [Chitinophagales bacterium]